MMKWFFILLVVALAVGWYWMVASGSWADRVIATHLRKASTAGTVEDMAAHISDVRDLVQKQQEWMSKLAFIARNPDKEPLRQADDVTKVLSALAQEGQASEGGEASGSQAEALRQALRAAMTMHTGFLPPGQHTFWAVLFWISAVGAGITGLLSFVRAASQV
jgi:hypothetical protein